MTLFFAVLSVLYTYPLVLDLRHSLIKFGGDYLGEATLVAWNAQQLLDAPLGLFDRQLVWKTQFFYPQSNSQAYLQNLLFPGLVGAPIFAWTRDALLTTNILLLLVLTASGVATWAVARSLTGAMLPGIVAGVVFTFLPHRMDHVGQFTTQWGVCLPVILWAQYRFLLEGRLTHLAVVVLGLWAQALSTLYYAFAGGLLLLAFTVGFLLLRPAALTPRLAVKSAAGVLLLGLLLLPFMAPYLAVHTALGMERSPDLAQVASLDLAAILDPGNFNRLYRGRLVGTGGVEGGLFPGFVALGLCLIAAAWLVVRDPSGDTAPAWSRPARAGVAVAALGIAATFVAVGITGVPRLGLGPVRIVGLRDLTFPALALPALALGYVALEGRRRREGPLGGREWVAVLAFLAVFTYLLTTGPTLMVAGRPRGRGFYYWLYHYVPGGRGFGAPGRWALVFVLCLALLAAFGMRILLGRVRGPAGAALGAGLLAVVMIEYVAFPIPWQHAPDPPAVYRQLASEPGDFAILELPVQEGGLETWAMYWATVHWKRTVNGSLSFFGPTLQEFADLTAPLQLGAFVEQLRSIYPLRYLLVHRDVMNRPGDAVFQHQLERWTALRGQAIPGIQLVGTFGQTDEYLVSPTPDDGLDLRRYFSTDIVRRRPNAAYAIRLDGRDPEVRRWVELSFNGRPLARLDGDVSEARRLAPPYRAGDRNELRFVHRYTVTRDAAQGPLYRIGGTAVQSPVDLRVESGGKFSGDVVSIQVSGVEAIPNPRRGYHVVALDPTDGRILVVDWFDTFRTTRESRRMAEVIDGLPEGAIVVAAVKHDGGGQLEAEGVRALHTLGAREDPRRTLWRAHIVIGVKGARPGEAVEAAGERHLIATIGRTRELGMTLEAFELR